MDSAQAAPGSGSSAADTSGVTGTFAQLPGSAQTQASQGASLSSSAAVATPATSQAAAPSGQDVGVTAERGLLVVRSRMSDGSTQTKEYRVRQGTHVITDEEMLAKMKNVALALFKAKGKHVTFSETGEVRVFQRRADGGDLSTPTPASVSSATPVTPEPPGQFALAEADRAEYNSFVTQAKTQVTAAATLRAELRGYSPETIKKAIGSIMNEGHLRLAGLVDENVRFTDEWPEETLADLLHYPGNEGLRAALLEVGSSPTSPNATNGDDTKESKCKRGIILYILQKMQRPARTVVGANGSSYEQVFTRGGDLTRTQLKLAVDGSSGKFVDQLQPIDGELLSAGYESNRNHGFPSEADKTGLGRPDADGSTTYGNLLEDQTPHCANLGAVRVRDSQGTVQSVFTRSGRTDSPERLLEVTSFAMMEHLATADLASAQREDHGCFHRVADTGGVRTFEFRHVISNYMDFTKLKALTDDERRYLQGMVEAIDAWPPEGIRVKMKTGTPPQDVIIVLKKPIMQSQPLSEFAAPGVGGAEYGQTRSDRTNFVNNQQLLARQFDRYVGEDDKQTEEFAALKTAATELNAKLQALLCPSPLPEINYLNAAGLIDWDRVPNQRLLQTAEKASLGEGPFFTSDEFHNYQAATARVLVTQLDDVTTQLEDEDKGSLDDDDIEELEKKRDSLISIYAIQFRRAPPTTSAGIQELIDTELTIPQGKTRAKFDWRPASDERLHALDLEIYRHNLCSDLGLSKGKQCKSGTDRTGVGVGVEEAVERFKMENGGRSFMPPTIPTNADERGAWKSTPAFQELLQFKQFFREGLYRHAAAVAIETKGYSGLKLAGISGNPVPNKYLYLEEDLVHSVLKDNGITQADVQGLTYANLAAKGSAQYKGALNVPLSIYGRSEGASRTSLGATLQPTALDKIKKAQKSVSQEEVNAVNEQVKNILKRELGLDLGQDPALFTRSLELGVHIRKLQLDARVDGRGRVTEDPDDPMRVQRLRILLERIKRGDLSLDVGGDGAPKIYDTLSKKEKKMLLYALESLCSLAERRIQILQSQQQSMRLQPSGNTMEASQDVTTRLRNLPRLPRQPPPVLNGGVLASSVSGSLNESEEEPNDSASQSPDDVSLP